MSALLCPGQLQHSYVMMQQWCLNRLQIYKYSKAVVLWHRYPNYCGSVSWEWVHMLTLNNRANPPHKEETFHQLQHNWHESSKTTSLIILVFFQMWHYRIDQKLTHQQRFGYRYWIPYQAQQMINSRKEIEVYWCFFPDSNIPTTRS